MIYVFIILKYQGRQRYSLVHTYTKFNQHKKPVKHKVKPTKCKKKGTFSRYLRRDNIKYWTSLVDQKLNKRPGI